MALFDMRHEDEEEEEVRLGYNPISEGEPSLVSAVLTGIGLGIGFLIVNKVAKKIETKYG